MKVIIAGSRSIQRYAHVVEAMRHAKQKGIEPTMIVSGGARGIDKLGEKWAKENGLPCERYSAEWNDLTVRDAIIKRRPGRNGTRYNARAGLDRNKKMCEVADALVAIWDGRSRGTAHMIDLMEKAGKPVFLVHVE